MISNMPKYNKNLSIIIVNFRSEDYLEKCLASVYKMVSGEILAEVVVVNNDEPDKLTEISKKFPGIKIIHQKENAGFGASNNLGVKIAQGELLLFLNPDTEIFSGNIEEIINEFEKNEKMGVIGPKLLKISGKSQEWSAGLEKNLWDLIRNNTGLIKSQKIWKSEKKIEAHWVAGTAMFTKKELFEKIGGFDEKYFMYFEDVDFCKGVRKAGKRIEYHPHFSVKHYGGKSYEGSDMQKKHYYDSQEYFFKKHYGKWQFVILKLLRKIFYS